jgi:hypothetical protein
MGVNAWLAWWRIGVALAQPSPLDAPWQDEAPHRVEQAIVVASLGSPDERITRGAPRRASARRQAEERAKRALHDWADDALASIQATAATAAAVHRAIDQHCVISRVRPLVDDGVVIELVLEDHWLEEVARDRRLPWVRE